MGYETFDRLCKAKGVTAYKVAQETGVSTSTLSSWKASRYTPKDEKMQKIADYFGVTVKYLRDEDAEERNMRYEETAKRIHENLEHRSALNITNEEWELISAFRYLNKEGQEKALQNVVDLTWIKKYRNDKNDDGYIRF